MRSGVVIRFDRSSAPSVVPEALANLAALIRHSEYRAELVHMNVKDFSCRILAMARGVWLRHSGILYFDVDFLEGG